MSSLPKEITKPMMKALGLDPGQAPSSQNAVLPPPTQIAPVTEMPAPATDTASIATSRRRAQAEANRRRGRAASILTANLDDTLG